MRLWSLHPSYLDAKGLVASWREALLAQKVLIGETKGYTKHPQLERFRECKMVRKVETTHGDSVAAVGAFLHGVHQEATKRSYKFDQSKIIHYDELVMENKIPVKHGQVQYEFTWLLSKLQDRDPKKFEELSTQIKKEGDKFIGIQTHPCFVVVDDDMNLETWEKITDPEKTPPKKSPSKSNTKRKRTKKVREEEEEEDEQDTDEEESIKSPRRVTRSQAKRTKLETM